MEYKLKVSFPKMGSNSKENKLSKENKISKENKHLKKENKILREKLAQLEDENDKLRNEKFNSDDSGDEEDFMYENGKEILNKIVRPLISGYEDKIADIKDTARNHMWNFYNKSLLYERKSGKYGAVVLKKGIKDEDNTDSDTGSGSSSSDDDSDTSKTSGSDESEDSDDD